MLLRDKIHRFASRGRNKFYDVRVDPLPSRYLKADEAAYTIVNRGLKKSLGYEPLRSLETVRDSRESAGIQIADVLLGAFMSGWSDEAVSEPKRLLRHELLTCLGWPDFQADTQRHEWKFNVWVYYEPGSGTRQVRGRPLRLKYPLRAYAGPHAVARGG